MTTTGLLVDEQDTLTGGATATFSPDRLYRYALTRRWADGPYTMFIMLNPSTADAFTDDPTIRRCTGFARTWGSAGLLVVNLFGLRATNPADLVGHPDPVGPDNDTVIADALSVPVDHVVAAWGDHRRLPERLPRIRELLAPAGLRLTCLGTTKSGQPRHPLYIPAVTALTTYE